MKKNAIVNLLVMMLGLMSVHAAGPAQAPAWVDQKVWTSTAALRSYAYEHAVRGSVGLSSSYYNNDGSWESIVGDGAKNLFAQIEDLELRYTTKVSELSVPSAYAYAYLNDAGGYTMLWANQEDVEPYQTDLGWKVSVDFNFEIPDVMYLPVDGVGDNIVSGDVVVYDSNGNAYRSYYLGVNEDGRLAFPTGLTGDVLPFGTTAEIILHYYNSNFGYYSKSYDLQSGAENPLGEVASENNRARLKGMIESTSSATAFGIVSENGYGTLPLVELTLTQQQVIAFGANTTEGERAVGFRLRQIGVGQNLWQEFSLPEGFESSDMVLPAGVWHVEYIWPSFREEERRIYDPWWWGGKG